MWRQCCGASHECWSLSEWAQPRTAFASPCCSLLVSAAAPERQNAIHPGCWTQVEVQENFLLGSGRGGGGWVRAQWVVLRVL